MKKSFNLFSFAVLAMTALVACSEQNLDNISTKDYFYNSDPAAASLVASTQSNVDAKSQLSSNGENPDVYWTEGDKVSVFQLQEQGYKNISFTTATDKATTASFTEDVTGSFNSEIETAAYAVYPYSKSNAVAVVDGKVTVTAEIPAVQTATNNSFAEETNLAVGVLEGGNVAFKNVCAYMRFYVTNGGKVQSITITGKNDEYVAGKVRITFNENGENKCYDRVFLHRAFPHELPFEFISVLGEEKTEIGIIYDVEDFESDTVSLLKCEIERRYYSPVIKEIKSVKERYGFSYWKVSLEDSREVSFTMQDTFKNILHTGEESLMLIDVDNNRFTISNVSALDSKSYRKIELYL